MLTYSSTVSLENKSKTLLVDKKNIYISPEQIMRNKRKLSKGILMLIVLGLQLFLMTYLFCLFVGDVCAPHCSSDMNSHNAVAFVDNKHIVFSPSHF